MTVSREQDLNEDAKDEVHNSRFGARGCLRFRKDYQDFRPDAGSHMNRRPGSDIVGQRL